MLICFVGIVNCAPAQCCVRPVAAPAGAFVRAGAGLRGGGGAIGKRVEPLRLRCAQPPPLSGKASLQATEGLFPARRVLRVVHACLFSFVRKRETACGRLRFYFAVGRDRLTAFSSAVRLSDLSGSLRACAFLYGDPDEATERRGDAENGVGGAAEYVFA